MALMFSARSLFDAYSLGRIFTSERALLARVFSFCSVPELSCFLSPNTSISEKERGLVFADAICPAFTQFLIVADETPTIFAALFTDICFIGFKFALCILGYLNNANVGVDESINPPTLSTHKAVSRRYGSSPLQSVCRCATAMEHFGCCHLCV